MTCIIANLNNVSVKNYDPYLIKDVHITVILISEDTLIRLSTARDTAPTGRVRSGTAFPSSASS